MSTANGLVSGTTFDVPRDNWITEVTTGYRCHVSLSSEEDGTYSAVVLNLPGAGSCGATEKEAMTNVREAIAGVIESYREDGEDIPWADPAHYSIPDEATGRWIIVNV